MANILFQDIQETDNDLLINPRTGDFDFGPSDNDHISDIILSFPGEWKQYPAIGVGVRQYVKSSGKEQELQRSVKLNLISDGYTVTNPKVEIDANGKVTGAPAAIRQ
jgi:hypothetical protein